MNDPVNLCGYSRSEFERLMAAHGKLPFHGRQIYKWIYKNLVSDFGEMTDLSKEIRQVLNDGYVVALPEVVERRLSSDGTEKFLCRLSDDNLIEMVRILDDESGRMTLCVSSQAGCPVGCRFCATGKIGFSRNLSVGEIVAQPMIARRLFGDKAFDNLVFMGMGEPLLNYDQVMAAVDIITDSLGMMLGAKRITISTAGVIPGIRRLTESRSKVNLAISLNAPDDALRSRLMPLADSYRLDKLLEAVREWTEVYKRRVTFEYILFKGINDSEADALKLSRLIKGIPCKINLLAYNAIEGATYIPPTPEEIDRFARVLYPRAPAVTVRKSRGGDIGAACGQLAGRKENK